MPTTTAEPVHDLREQVIDRTKYFQLSLSKNKLAELVDDAMASPDPLAHIEQYAIELVTVEHLFEGHRFYSIVEIENRIGIRGEDLAAASKVGAFSGEQRGHVDLRSQDGGLLISGRALIDWITREKIHHRITNETSLDYYYRTRQLHQPASPPPAPETVVDRAVELSQQTDKELREADEQFQHAAYHTYTEILARADKPQATDAEMLKQILRDLELGAEQVQADAKMIADYRRCVELAAGEADARERFGKATEEHQAVKKRVQQEERNAYRKRIDTQARYHYCVKAARRLRELPRQRPQLFAVGPDGMAQLASDAAE